MNKNISFHSSQVVFYRIKFIHKTTLLFVSIPHRQSFIEGCLQRVPHTHKHVSIPHRQSFIGNTLYLNQDSTAVFPFLIGSLLSQPTEYGIYQFPSFHSSQVVFYPRTSSFYDCPVYRFHSSQVVFYHKIVTEQIQFLLVSIPHRQSFI